LPAYWPGSPIGLSTVYGEARYAAGSWKQERRVILKSRSRCAPKIKRRRITRVFVITNMNQTPQWLYEEVYCQRGEIEKPDQRVATPWKSTATSCSRFWANQFRVLHDCRRLCADAGNAPGCCWHQLRSGASLDSAGTLPETGGAGDGLSAAHGCAPAAIVPISRRPSGTWRWNWEHRLGRTASLHRKTSRSA